jgi:hypothetical protein
MISVLGDVKLCSLADVNRLFGRGAFFRNSGKHLTDYTSLHPKKVKVKLSLCLTN